MLCQPQAQQNAGNLPSCQRGHPQRTLCSQFGAFRVSRQGEAFMLILLFLGLVLWRWRAVARWMVGGFLLGSPQTQ